jgi:hypothetical protein
MAVKAYCFSQLSKFALFSIKNTTLCIELRLAQIQISNFKIAQLLSDIQISIYPYLIVNAKDGS